MIVLILATVIILAIAYLQMKQGLYSAMVMTVCTVLSAALAMATFKEVSSLQWVQDNFNPMLARGGILALLFFVSLFTLRTIADKLLSQDIYFNLIIDRTCSGILGIITGMTLVGILLVVTQLLPISATILDYKPYSDDLQRDQTLSPFYPDDFVVGLGNMVSSNWAEDSNDNGNLLLDAFCSRNTAELQCRRDADKDALKSAKAYEITAKRFIEDLPSNLDLPDNLTRVFIVHTELDAEKTIDPDKWWRLPATQFRLKCSDGKYYYPVSYYYFNKTKRAWRFIKNGDKNSLTAQLAVQRPEKKDKVPDSKLVIDWVYRIPKNDDIESKKVSPKKLTFRQSCEKNVTVAKKTFPFGNADMKKEALKAISTKKK